MEIQELSDICEEALECIGNLAALFKSVTGEDETTMNIMLNHVQIGTDAFVDATAVINGMIEKHREAE